MDAVSLALVLTPHGHLVLIEEPEAPSLDRALAGRLRSAFEPGPGHGLLWLGATEAGTALPPVGAVRVDRPAVEPDFDQLGVEVGLCGQDQWRGRFDGCQFTRLMVVWKMGFQSAPRK